MGSAHQTFTRLVDFQAESLDMVGLVAYSFYKLDKLAWMETFERHNGRAPTEAELEDQYFPFLENKLAGFRANAQQRLSEFIDASLGREMLRLRDQIKDDEVMLRIQASGMATAQLVESKLNQIEQFVNPTVWSKIKGWAIQTMVVGLITAGVAAVLFIVVWASALRDDPAMKKAVNDKVAQVVQEKLGTQ